MKCYSFNDFNRDSPDQLYRQILGSEICCVLSKMMAFDIVLLIFPVSNGNKNGKKVVKTPLSLSRALYFPPIKFGVDVIGRF